MAAEADAGDDVLGPELQQCPNCGAVGLEERIDDHDCERYIEEQGR